MTLPASIQKFLPLLTAVAGALVVLAATRGCDGTATPAAPVAMPSGENARTEAAIRDSIAAVLYAEIRAELELESAGESAGKPKVIRVPADTAFIAVPDSTLTDSLRRLRADARAAIAIAKRAQAELQLLRGRTDVLAVLDDTLAVPEAECVFTSHAEYSYRDASFKNVRLTHTWIEEHMTLWDTLVAYAPYAAGALALIKTIVDLLTPAP